jgi:hypothetical protein
MAALIQSWQAGALVGGGQATFPGGQPRTVTVDVPITFSSHGEMVLCNQL